MQRNNGIYKALSLGWIYDWFQHLVGSKQARAWLVRNIWKCKAGEKIVDMGCGTGEVLSYLPSDIDYVGSTSAKSTSSRLEKDMAGQHVSSSEPGKTSSTIRTSP
jgi:hypothetical protein